MARTRTTIDQNDVVKACVAVKDDKNLVDIAKVIDILKQDEQYANVKEQSVRNVIEREPDVPEDTDVAEIMRRLNLPSDSDERILPSELGLNFKLRLAGQPEFVIVGGTNGSSKRSSKRNLDASLQELVNLLNA